MAGDLPADRIIFACAADGLARTLEQGLLGGYDGAGAWALAPHNIRDAPEQLMVETHEGLHHELQASSGFGLMSAMALLLARRGFRSHALTELFHALAHDATHTHEVFATTLSASVAGVDQARAMLAGNAAYLGYLRRGLALGGDPETAWRYRETAAAAVLRCCMAPAGVFDLLELGFANVSRRGLTVRGGLPDERLAAFEAAGGPAAWRSLVTKLAADFPEQFAAERDPGRRQLPDNLEELAQRRIFDEDILLRQCYEQARCVLDSAGLPSVAWAEQEQVAYALKAAVQQVDADLANRLNVVTDRRPIMDDGLEFDRQKLVLRSPLPAEILDPPTTIASLPTFVAESPDGMLHACGVWLLRRVAEKQFAISPGISLPDVVVALLVRAGTAHGSAVRLGLLPASTTPRQLQDMLGDVPLLILTTHYTLTDEAVLSALRRVEPVFVLMDLPVAWHIDHWLNQGASVSMALTPIEGVGAAKLYLAAFAVDRSPGLRFISVGGEAGVSILVERLRRRHGGKLIINGDVLRDVVTNVNLMLSHVFAVWHSLDQDAVE